jgi:hypothetical protein
LRNGQFPPLSWSRTSGAAWPPWPWLITRTSKVQILPPLLEALEAGLFSIVISRKMLEQAAPVLGDERCLAALLRQRSAAERMTA